MTTAQHLSAFTKGEGQGESFSMMGITLTVKVSAEESGGALSLIEQAVKPGSGSPLHILHEGDKTISVLAGTFAITMGDRVVEAQAGAMVFLPAGVVHNFKNIGAAEGRILVAVTPGGHERFLRDLAGLAARGELTSAMMAAVAQSHNVQMLPPRG